MSESDNHPSTDKPSLLRRIRDWLWGYDFFVSYHWASGGAYAVNLAARLRERGYEVFLDRGEYAMGDDWRSVGRVALHNTQRLVLVATSEAVFESKPVAREVEIFTERGRHCVPIFFGDTFASARDEGSSSVLERLPEGTLYIDEQPAQLERGPSAATVDKLAATHHVTRRRSLRRTITGTTIVVLATFAGLATLSWRDALSSQRKAEKALYRTRKAQQKETLAQMAEQVQEQRALAQARESLAGTSAYLAQGVLAQSPGQSLRIAERAWGISPTNRTVSEALYEIAYAAPQGFELWRTVVYEKEKDEEGGEDETLALSPDGERIVAGVADRVQLLSTTGETNTLLELGGRSVLDLAFLPGGDQLAVVVEGELVVVGLDGVRSTTTSLPELVGVEALAFSDDGAILAAVESESEGRVRVFGPKGEHSFPADWVTELVLSPTGRMVAFVIDDEKVELHELNDPGPGRTIEPDGQVWALEFSPDGKALMIGDDGQITRYWIETGNDETYASVGSAVNDLSFSPRGNLLLSASDDGVGRVWAYDADEDAELIKTLPHPSIPGTELIDGPRKRDRNEMKQARFDPRGDRVATVLADGSVGYWFLGAELTPRQLTDESVMSVAFSFDDSLVLSVTAKGMAHVWSIPEMKGVNEQQVLDGESLQINVGCFATDAAHFATGDERGNLSIFETLGARVDRAAEAHAGGVTDCAWSPRGEALATVGADGQVALWSFAQGKGLRRREAPVYRGETSMWSLAFADHGAALVVGGVDEHVRLLDLDGRELRTFPLDSDTSMRVDELALDGAEQRLLMIDSSAKFAHVRSLDGRELARVEVSDITAGTIEAGGRRIATGGETGQLRLWALDEDEHSAQELGVIETGDYVNDVAWSHDGEHIATAGDGGVVLWIVSEAGLIAKFDELGLPELDAEFDAELGSL